MDVKPQKIAISDTFKIKGDTKNQNLGKNKVISWGPYVEYQYKARLP